MTLYGWNVSLKRWLVYFLVVVEKLGFKAFKLSALLVHLKIGEQYCNHSVVFDDILFDSNSDQIITQVKAILENEFFITLLGLTKTFLGHEIEREKKLGHSCPSEV